MHRLAPQISTARRSFFSARAEFVARVIVAHRVRDELLRGRVAGRRFGDALATERCGDANGRDRDGAPS